MQYVKEIVSLFAKRLIILSTIMTNLQISVNSMIYFILIDEPTLQLLNRKTFVVKTLKKCWTRKISSSTRNELEGL